MPRSADHEDGLPRNWQPSVSVRNGRLARLARLEQGVEHAPAGSCSACAGNISCGANEARR